MICPNCGNPFEAQAGVHHPGDICDTCLDERLSYERVQAEVKELDHLDEKLRERPGGDIDQGGV